MLAPNFTSFTPMLTDSSAFRTVPERSLTSQELGTKKKERILQTLKVHTLVLQMVDNRINILIYVGRPWCMYTYE